MSKKLFRNLIEWSESQYSHLPWRVERSLYRTLVSEIMLQQTTVSTVLNHFEKLAKASEEEVCIAWKGLGYYRRARNLRNIAIQVVEEFQGKIPTTIEELSLLKGVGPYTANALVAIGADKRGLAVDANLERVLARFYGFQSEKGLKLQKEISESFKQKKIVNDIEVLGPRALNEAFMDLGRIICQARKASCTLCPLKSECVAFKSGEPLNFPVEGSKALKEDLYIKLLRVVVAGEKKKFLFYKKAESEWLAGQWELPTFILETNDESLVQYPRLKTKKTFKDTQIIKGGITKYSIENHVVKMSMDEFEKLAEKSHCSHQYQFKTYDEQLNLSTSSIKALKKI